MSIRQLTDGGVDGSQVGQSASDKIAFFGGTPTSQRTNPFQQQTWGLPQGQVISFASNIGTAVTVVKNTTTVGSLACPGVVNNTSSVAGGDFVLGVSKPTSQAGAGIVGFRANATNTVELVFANPTGAHVATTVNETYIATIIRNAPVINANISLGTLAANTVTEAIINLAPMTTATATVNANLTLGTVGSVTMVNNGAGYVIPPTVVFSPPYPANTTINPAGDGYVTTAVPDGVTATGIATINAAGQVSGVIMTNPGSGYFVQPTVAFIGGNVVMPGMALAVNKTSANLANLAIVNARVSAVNQVAIQVAAIGANVAATANDTYQFLPIMTMPPVSPLLQFQANCANATITTANVANTTSVACPGVLVSDFVIASGSVAANTGGVYTQPPATANNLVLYYMGGGNTAWTPPAGVYNWTLFKPAPQPPVQVFQVPLTFTAATANTTTEIVVTLPTGIDLYSGQSSLAANTVQVIVNKPPLTSGLGIVNARANSNTTIGISFLNTTTSNITPPAETYTIAVVPCPLPTLGANVLAGQCGQTIGASFNQMMYLTNEMQQTLQTMGLIRGA